MKLSVLMTVYNEVEFVEYAIRACLENPLVDNLVIVEGAYQESIDVGASPRSTDGTFEKISKSFKSFASIEPNLKDSDNFSLTNPGNYANIHYIQANEKTDKDQRNIGLEKIKELSPDGYLLIVDGDEIYTPENFQMVKVTTQNMARQNKLGAYFKSLTFVNDAWTYCEQEFPRLFKITSQCFFSSDNYMVWPDLGKSWEWEVITKNPYLRYHHYAFCKDKDHKRFKLKKEWWNTRFGENSKFEYDWYVDENDKIWSPNHKLVRYTGRHPAVMKNHPLLQNEEM